MLPDETQECSRYPSDLEEDGYRPLSSYAKEYNIPQSTLASAAGRGALIAQRQCGHKLRPYWARPQDVIAWLRRYRPHVLEGLANQEQPTSNGVMERMSSASLQMTCEGITALNGTTSQQAPSSSGMPCFQILPGADRVSEVQDSEVIDVESTADAGQDENDESTQRTSKVIIPLEWPEEFEDFASAEADADEAQRDSLEDDAADLPPEPTPSTFTFFDGSVCEGILYDGLPYVELDALCRILDIKKTWDVAKRLRREGYEVLSFIARAVTTGGSEAVRRKLYIGLDSAMFIAASSRKRIAREATKWLYQTVFMSIVRKGYYAAPGVEGFPDWRILEAQIQEGSIAKRLAEENRLRVAILNKQQAEMNNRLAGIELVQIRCGSLIDHTLSMTAQVADEIETTKAAQLALEERLSAEQSELRDKTTDLENKFQDLEKREMVRQWLATVTLTCDTQTEWLRVFNTIIRNYASDVIKKSAEWQRLDALRMQCDYNNEEYRRITGLMNDMAKPQYEGAYNAFYRRLKASGGIDVFARVRARERKSGRRPAKIHTINAKERPLVMRLLLLRLGELGVAPRWLREMSVWRAFWALEELKKDVPFEAVHRKYATYH